MEICTGREPAVFGYIVYIEIYHLTLREKLSRHLYSFSYHMHFKEYVTKTY